MAIEIDGNWDAVKQLLLLYEHNPHPGYGSTLASHKLTFNKKSGWYWTINAVDRDYYCVTMYEHDVAIRNITFFAPTEIYRGFLEIIRTMLDAQLRDLKQEIETFETWMKATSYV